MSLIIFPDSSEQEGFAVEGVSNTNTSTSIDMRRMDKTVFGFSPYIIPYDCELVHITAGAKLNQTWDAAVLKNGTVNDTLSVVASKSAFSGDLNSLYSQGDEVRLRQINAAGNVKDPSIVAYFKRL